MALLQISEPSQSIVREQSQALGIDFGTTNSLVAYADDGSIRVLTLDGKQTIASTADYCNQIFSMGQAHGVPSIKRFIGRSFTDLSTEEIEQFPFEICELEGSIAIYINGELYSVQSIAKDMFAYLLAASKQHLDKVSQAVITVPAYFNEARRGAIAQAANQAGIEVLRLLSEPTAAAIAYGLDTQEDGIIAVYDFGGGTFDISILELSRGVFQVLATGGNTKLGGDDIDQAIMRYILKQWVTEETKDKLSLLQTVRSAKEALNIEKSVSIKWKEYSLDFSLDMLNEIARLYIEKTIKICKRTLRDAKIKQVDRVVMVGGSTRLNCVQQAMAEYFTQAKIYKDVDPDLVVAQGAAIQAAALTGQNSSSHTLVDVVPLSLGLETAGGLIDIIIERNTSIPIKKVKEFTTQRDGQTAMKISLAQGEREMFADCYPLGEFELRGIPPMVAGMARIEITFALDADGLLNVVAQEKTSGMSQSMHIKPAHGLDFDLVDKALKESRALAQQDLEARALAEARVELQTLTQAVSGALEKDGNMLDDKEITTLKEVLAIAKGCIQIEDRNKIREISKNLASASDSFAQKRMNYNINKTLQGKTLEELDA